MSRTAFLSTSSCNESEVCVLIARIGVHIIKSIAVKVSIIIIILIWSALLLLPVLLAVVVVLLPFIERIHNEMIVV